MLEIMPSTSEWVNDDMRPSLITILRRLDKTFAKIYKKAVIRRNTNWDAATVLIDSVYETLKKNTFIAHFANVKSLLSICQLLIIGDTGQIEVTNGASLALMSKIPPQNFCSAVLRLLCLQILSLGEGYSLETTTGGYAMFSSAARTENLLLNLFIPLFFRVMTRNVREGMRSKIVVLAFEIEFFFADIVRLQQCDIVFSLTVILNTLWPPGAKAMMAQAAPSVKAIADVRTGSLTFTRDSKTLTKVPQSLYQVAFLGIY